MPQSIYQKIFNKNKNKNKKNKAFTLIEILIYTAIFSVVAAGIMGVTWNITRIHDTQIAETEVDENIRYVTNLINSKVRESIIIEEATGTTLILQMPDSTKSPVKFSLNEGIMYMQVGSEDPVAITTDKVQVSNLSFERIAVAGAKGGVKVNMTIAYKATDTKTIFSRDYLTTVTKVNAITFDSDILPDVTNLRSVGVESLRWKNGYFSGDVNVSGNVTASGYITGTTGLCMNTDCRTSWGQITGLTGSGTLNYISKWTSSGTLGNSQIFDNGTNVGIGTTGPTQKLDINGDLKVGGGDIYGGITGGVAGIWRYSTTYPDYGIFYSDLSVDRIDFSPNGGGTSTPAMSISGTNVGIGTTSPAIKLAIGDTDTGIQWISDGNLGIYTNGAERIRINSSGNVGIGTTAPVNKLHVNENIGATGWIGAGCESSCESSGGYAILYPSGYLSLNGANIYGLSSGNVGIGTTSPSYKLHVSGDVGFTGTLQQGTVPWARISGFTGDTTPDTIADDGVITLTTETSGNYVAGLTAGNAISITGTAGEGWSPTVSVISGSGSGLDADLLDGHDSSYFQTALTNPVTGTGATNYISKWTGTNTQGNSIVYDDGTNVGIGITSPGTALQVAGATGVSIGEDKASGTANTAGTMKLFSAGDNAYYTTLTAGTQTANAGYTLPTALPTGTAFLKSSNTGVLSWDTSTYLTGNQTITLSGDVTGSGTTSITTTIAANAVALGTDTTGNYVAGLTAGTGISVSGTAGEGWSPTIALSTSGVTAGTYRSVTVDAYGRVTAGTNPTTFSGYGISDTSANLASAITDETGSGALVFGTSPTFSGNVTFPGTGIWNSSGNVGIGTTSPAYKLDVAGDIRATGNLLGTLSATNISAGAFGANTGGGNFSFPANLTVDTDTFFVDSVNNRVGIGTTTPDEKLHLKVASGNLTFKMTTGDSDWKMTASSDGTLKITNAISGSTNNDAEVNLTGKLKVNDVYLNSVGRYASSFLQTIVSGPVANENVISTATCPSGYILVGCSAARTNSSGTMADVCNESDCGIVGAQPSGNSCKSLADGSYHRAYAICIK